MSRIIRTILTIIGCVPLLFSAGCGSSHFVPASGVSYAAETEPLYLPQKEFAFKAPAIGTKFIVTGFSVYRSGDRVMITNRGEQGEQSVVAVDGVEVKYRGYRDPKNQNQEWSVLGHLFTDVDGSGQRWHLPDRSLFEKFWPVSIGKSTKFDINLSTAWYRFEYSVRRTEMLKSKIGKIETVYIEGNYHPIPARSDVVKVLERIWYAPSLGLIVRHELEFPTEIGSLRTIIVEVVKVTPP